jgi:hypothetical protein
MLPYTLNDAKLPANYIVPLQLVRLSEDINTWVEALSKAENAWYPTRYYMQRMYAQMINEGTIFSALEKRRNLTLLKDFIIVDAEGNESVEHTKIFKDKMWFNTLLSSIIDAQFYGYSLLQIGDIVIKPGNVYDFPRMFGIRRWNVEPDRQNEVRVPLQRQGIDFLDPNAKDDEGIPFSDWTIYVDTPSDVGHSICGYGLLYQMTLYGIYLRNNLADNASYTEMFSQPYRHGKYPGVLDDTKRKQLENALDSMGSSGFLLTDDNFMLDFKETATGTGYKSYESLEKRCKDMISRIVFGHESAMSTTPGKMGSGQGEQSPESIALLTTEKKQDSFTLITLNDVVLPKLRNLGVKIPDGFQFAITNDREEFEARIRNDEANAITANLFLKIHQAGGKPDWNQFAEITGLNVEEAPMMPTVRPFTPQQKAKLKSIYK